MVKTTKQLSEKQSRDPWITLRSRSSKFVESNGWYALSRGGPKKKSPLK